MNYIGSKLSLIPFINRVITEVYKGDFKNATFCDLFAGTGIVGRHFKPIVKKVISNDIEYYSYVLNRNYIGNHVPIKGAEYFFEQLETAPLENNGFIFHNYSEGGKSNRLYFNSINGKKIDTIRIQIEKWRDSNTISNDLYYHLLASLIESADKVANTASVYGAFLKKLKKSALVTLQLQPALYHINEQTHDVYQEDANELIGKIKGDILYLDPPYNSRQYGANYHLLNTIASYKEFEPQGKTGLPEYTKTLYCKRSTVKAELNDLIANADFPFVFLSYNNEGLLSLEDIQDIFTSYGTYTRYVANYKRFQSDQLSRRNHKATNTTEFLHVLIKS